jgi:hypothetical protein
MGNHKRSFNTTYLPVKSHLAGKRSLLAKLIVLFSEGQQKLLAEYATFERAFLFQ